MIVAQAKNRWKRGCRSPSASDPLKKHPIVRMETAQNGMPPLLIVEERTHDGTIYDAAVYRYFEIG